LRFHDRIETKQVETLHGAIAGVGIPKGRFLPLLLGITHVAGLRMVASTGQRVESGGGLRRVPALLIDTGVTCAGGNHSLAGWPRPGQRTRW